MRSHSSLTSTNKLPKFLPLALSALITFAPLVYFAKHSVKLDIRNSGQQIIEMQLLENLKKTIALPQQFQQPSQPSQLPQQVIPNLVPLPSSDSEPTQNTRIENSITQAPLPAEVVEPKTLNLNVSPKARDSTYKSSQSPVKQLIEDESAKASKKQTEKFANDVKNSAKPDCLKNDYGLGIFNVVPLIYDIAKDKCN
jgi:hypothetical protein